MPLRALPYLALTTLLIMPAVTRAGEASKHVDLVCDAAANLALVRFSVSSDPAPAFPRLPQALDRGLSASRGSGRTDCTLANGTTIRARGGQEQGYAYGMGGANPPAFFSLWINQRKVLSRRLWMPGYAESVNTLPVYEGVLIAQNRITVCATAQGKPQRCASEPFDLAKAPVDRVEYGAATQKAPIGQVTVIAKGADNQRFCQTYLSSIKPGFDSALRGERTPLDIDFALLNEQTKVDGSEARSGVIGLAPGAARRLVIWGGDSHYFDGTVVAVAPSSTITQNLIAAYPFEDIENWPKRAAPSNVTLISGGQKQLYPAVSPRYVHLVPQLMDGSLYFFAYPTNKKVRPSAALVKPLPDGGFATLCAFNRTEPHY